MSTVDQLLASLRVLAEAMLELRGHVRFNDQQNAALEHACELIVQLELGKRSNTIQKPRSGRSPDNVASSQRS